MISRRERRGLSPPRSPAALCRPTRQRRASPRARIAARDSRGQGLVEYALIVALIVIGAVAGFDVIRLAFVSIMCHLPGASC